MIHVKASGVSCWIGALSLTSAAGGQTCVEWTADGQECAATCHEKVSGGATAPAGGSAPFGVAPDWQNAIRRQVSSLQFADLNGDGWLDLAVGCFQSNSFPPYNDWRNFIHYNVGGSLEIAPSWVSADQVHTNDLQIADFNTDGYPDIFSANGGFAHSPSVMYMGGPAGPDAAADWSSATPISTWALSAGVSDFDHDGDVDIVTTNQSGIQNDWHRPLYMFENVNGQVQATPTWQSSDVMISNGIGVGDYDGDGWEDIAVAKWVNFTCAVYRNAGGELGTSPEWNTGDAGGARGALLGDLSGDGAPELLFGYDPTRQYANIDGSFVPVWESTIASPSVQVMRLHDVDADGDLDLAEVHFSTGRTHIYLNQSGVLDASPAWTHDSTLVGNSLAFGDVNGDGCADLAIGYSGEPSVVLFLAECAAPCPADATGDAVVNVDDLLAVISEWGGSGPKLPADVTGDGVVDVNDLLLVIGSWGDC